MSKFLSANHLDLEDGLGIVIKVLADNDEYIPTFFLSIPERDMDIEEFTALIDGLTEARYKIQQLVEIFEDGEDN
jgi:hypothetical protein